MSDDPAIRLRRVEMHHGKRLVLSLDELDFATGEIHSIVGGNGAGKSTLLRTIAGLQPPSRGTVDICGMDLYAAGRKERLTAQRCMTLCLQKPTLFRSSVQENIAYGLRFRDLTLPERRRRVEEAAITLGVDHLLARRARGLSGGESQRVALARAFALRPRLLLLDEPVASVDQEYKGRVLDALRTLAAQRCTVLIATHWTTQIRALSANAVRLEKGRLAPPALENLFSGTVVIGTAGAPVLQLTHNVQLPILTQRTGNVRAAVDPNAVQLHSAVSPPPGSLSGRIIALREMEDMIHATVDAGIVLRAHMKRDTFACLAPCLGDAVAVFVPPEATTIY